MEAKEFDYGLMPMAESFEMIIRENHKHGKHYDFSEDIQDGWISEIPVDKGFFASSWWFTTKKKLEYTFNVDKLCMMFFEMDCGDITITQNGIKSQHITSRNHVFINSRRSFRLTIPENVHVCCTCLFIFDEFVQRTIVPIFNEEFNLEHAKKWTSPMYNTPDIIIVMEQIKWAVRKTDMPLFNYKFKLGELFSIIICNNHSPYRLNFKREYHVSWDIQKKIFTVAQKIHEDVLNSASIDELAADIAISTSKLHRCFKSVYGMTISEYIHLEKMKRAVIMMANDEYNIKNIAQRCGYKSPNMFSKAFKKIYGFTPIEYRKAFNL